MNEQLMIPTLAYESHVVSVRLAAEALGLAIENDKIQPSRPLGLRSLRLLSVDPTLQCRLAALNTAQATLASTIALLSDQLSTLTMRDKALRTLLVPIHLLPAEIMLRIFSLVYQSHGTTERAACSVLLASVCRSWRRLTIQAPELWNTYNASWCRNYGKLISSRAGRGRVDVIFTEESAGSHTQLPPVERWNSLSLSCSPESPSWDVFIGLLPSLQPLKSLTLDMDAMNPDQVEFIHLGRMLPSLTSLHVVNIPSSIIWSPLGSHLISLRFDVVLSDRGLRRILFECTNLESLVIGSIITSEGSLTDIEETLLSGAKWADEPLVVPQSLRTLVFRQIRPRYLCHLSKWLRAPAIKELVLCTSFGSVAGSECLGKARKETHQRFFAQFVGLEKLAVKCDARLLLDILSAMHVGLPRSSPASVVVARLDSDSFLPNLRELRLTVPENSRVQSEAPVHRQHQSLKEELGKVLKAIQNRSRVIGNRQRVHLLKILHRLQLSGFAITKTERVELENYVWVLQV